MNSHRGVILGILLLILPLVNGHGQGISFDAGLTPAQNRLILRSQFRAFSMTDGTMTTQTQMFPLVVAYGVKPGFTMMFRNIYRRQRFSSSGDVINRMMDPLLLAKFRLYRKNTAAWVLGIAPHLATNLPLGFAGMAENTWKPELGLNISFRPRFLSFDLSTVYQVNDLFAQSASYNGQMIRVNAAFASVFPVSANGELAVAPVVEMNYLHTGNQGVDRSMYSNLLFVSPGTSLITNFGAIEMLLQVPLYQEDLFGDMEQQMRLITGLKFMF